MFSSEPSFVYPKLYFCFVSGGDAIEGSFVGALSGHEFCWSSLFLSVGLVREGVLAGWWVFLCSRLGEGVPLFPGQLIRDFHAQGSGSSVFGGESRVPLVVGHASTSRFIV